MRPKTYKTSHRAANAHQHLHHGPSSHPLLPTHQLTADPVNRIRAHLPHHQRQQRHRARRRARQNDDALLDAARRQQPAGARSQPLVILQTLTNAAAQWLVETLGDGLFSIRSQSGPYLAHVGRAGDGVKVVGSEVLSAWKIRQDPSDGSMQK